MRAVLIPLSFRRSGPQWSRMRGHEIGGLGRFLAMLALLLQIASPGSSSPPAVDFDNDAAGLVHALCLGSREGATEQPAKQAPSRDHSSHSHAICCFSYRSIGLCITSAVAPEPVAFASTSVVFQLPSQATRSRFAGTVGARAPPERA